MFLNFYRFRGYSPGDSIEQNAAHSIGPISTENVQTMLSPAEFGSVWLSVDEYCKCFIDYMTRTVNAIFIVELHGFIVCSAQCVHRTLVYAVTKVMQRE